MIKIVRNQFYIKYSVEIWELTQKIYPICKKTNKQKLCTKKKNNHEMLVVSLLMITAFLNGNVKNDVVRKNRIENLLFKNHHVDSNCKC